MRSKPAHPIFPPLETERLRLRDFRANDAAFVLRLWSEPVVTEHMIVDPPITTLAQAALNVRAFRRRRRSFHRWVLELRETGEAIAREDDVRIHAGRSVERTAERQRQTSPLGAARRPARSWLGEAET